MSRRGPRPVVFVCISVSNDCELLTKDISAESQAEAADLFFEEFKVKPKEIHGPFRKKMAQVLETTRELKFTNQTRKAIYNDWEVNAFILKEPAEQAYLVFLKRTDNKKIPFPKGTITVPLSELRFI